MYQFYVIPGIEQDDTGRDSQQGCFQYAVRALASVWSLVGEG